MIKVTVGNNTSRSTVIVSETSTVRQVLEGNNIDYSRGSVLLDGVTLGVGDFDKSFREFGIAERCFLSAVTKADNA